MKSSNFALIIFILIALLYIGFYKIDCQRVTTRGPPRDYGNWYRAYGPKINDYPTYGSKNRVPIRVTPNGHKTSNQRKISGSVGMKDESATNSDPNQSLLKEKFNSNV
jgi:hypothetical protein